MSSIGKTARFAGFLYLLVTIATPISLMYVPGKLIVRDNPAATARNILASQGLFRLGIVSGLVSALILMFVGLALCRLLQRVNQRQAALMVILMLVQVSLAFLSEVNRLAALILVQGGDSLSGIAESQCESLAMLFLNLHGQGNTVTEVFWRLWLFPFGLLVFRSGFLLRILGVWLLINGCAYVALSLTGLLAPQYSHVLFGTAFPALFGEMAIMLWLLIMGGKEAPMAEPAAVAPAA
jgi:hypothetical protein